MHRLDPELAVLIHCARPNISAKSRLAVENLLAQGLDWQRLTRLVEKHALISTLYLNLRSIDKSKLPTAAFKDLGQIYIQTLHNRVSMMSELVKLQSQFESSGIHAIYFKGLVLGELFYGDVNLRECNDIDILVHPEDALEAEKILLRNNYKYGHDKMELWRQAEFLQTPYSLRFLTQLPFHGQSTFDLHWLVFENGLIKLPTSFLFSHAKKHCLLDVELLTLPPEILLILVCTHGVKSDWCRLKWIVDVAQIIENSNLDWDKTLTLARETKAYSIVLLGCALASHLPDVTLPVVVMDALKSRADLLGTARELLDSLFERPGTGERKLLERWLFYLSVKDSNWDRLVLALRLSTDARIDDWLRYRLPEPVFFLYRILHLCHLARVSAPHLVQRLRRICNRIIRSTKRPI